jgi:hypothetical protein
MKIKTAPTITDKLRVSLMNAIANITVTRGSANRKLLADEPAF